MRDSLQILDADRHVIEPIEMWRRYLPQVPPACLRGETAALTPDCGAGTP